MSLRPVVLTTILSLLAGVVEPGPCRHVAGGRGFCYGRSTRSSWTRRAVGVAAVGPSQ